MTGALTRREILSRLGRGAAALPLLHARAHGASAPAFPRRLVLFTVPSCGPRELFWPRGTETEFTLSTLTAPLQDLKRKLTFVAGLAFYSAYASGGDFAVHQSFFHMLTGAKMVKPAPFQNGAGGPSIDWTLAHTVPALKALPFPQLVVGFNDGDYGNTRAAPKSPGAPAPQLSRLESPTSLFDQLFTGRALPGSTVDPALARVRAERASVLDYLGKSLSAYSQRLGSEDRDKIDFHLDAIRELEKGLAAGPATSGCTPGSKPPGGDFAKVTNVPALVQQQLDVVVAALACDLTRVVTFQWSGDGGNKWNYPWLGNEFNTVPPKDLDPEGTGLINQHYLQHQAWTSPSLTAMRAKLEGWWLAQYAYLARKLDAVREGDGTMLDNTALVFFAAQGLPGDHGNYMNPVILAGSCGGYFKTGRYVRLGTRTDFNDVEGKATSRDGMVAHNRLLASLVNAMGLDVATYGMPDFGGALSELRS